LAQIAPDVVKCPAFERRAEPHADTFAKPPGIHPLVVIGRDRPLRHAFPRLLACRYKAAPRRMLRGRRYLYRYSLRSVDVIQAELRVRGFFGQHRLEIALAVLNPADPHVVERRIDAVPEVLRAQVVRDARLLLKL